MKKIFLISILFFICSCNVPEFIPEYFKNSELKATFKNNSGQEIKSLTFGAEQYSRKYERNITTDSVVVFYLKSGDSTNIKIDERKLNGYDGFFYVKVVFQNNTKLKSDCCYLTNGKILYKTANFEILKGSILLKNTQLHKF